MTDRVALLSGTSPGRVRPSVSHPDLHKRCTRQKTYERAMTDPDLATLLALLDDEHVRSILAATSERPMSASELGEHCGLSTTSIYRRLDRLSDVDLVGEQTRPRSDGHHESVYVSRLDRFELTVRDGELSWECDRQHTDVADQLTELWGRF